MRVYKRGRIWWCRYYDASASKHRRVSTHLTDKGAAEAHGRRLERDGADPDGATAAKAKLADALDAVIAEYEKLVREKQKAAPTVKFYRKRASQVLRMVQEGLLPPLLADLRAKHVDAMIDFRRTEGSSRSTIAKDLTVLRLGLKLAKRRGMWFGDVDAVLPHRFGIGYEPVARWLSPTELWALLPVLRVDRAAWVAFAIATGANYSEAQKASRNDVSIRSVHLRGTKRKSRDRHAPIVFEWQRVLLDIAMTYPGARTWFAAWSLSNMNRDLKLACAKVGIPSCSSNDLRRTFGTWMRASGAPLELLSPAMGHVDGRMVERVYAKLNVQQLATLLGAAPTVPPLYRPPSSQASLTHSSRAAAVCFPAGSGSDCWTRTSDPVINSHLAIPADSTGYGFDCAAVVQPILFRLRKAVRSLSAAWALPQLLESA